LALVKPAVVRVFVDEVGDVTSAGVQVDKAGIASFVSRRIHALSAQGRRFSTVFEATRAAMPDFVLELAAHPATYLHLSAERMVIGPGAVVIQGSGVVVDSSGYVLTTTSVAPDSQGLLRLVGQSALATQIQILTDQAQRSAGVTMTGDELARVGAVLLNLLLPTVQADVQPVSFDVNGGHIGTGRQGPLGFSHATVIATLALGTVGVSVLRVERLHMPSLGIAATDPQAGMQVGIVGYAANRSDGGDTDGQPLDASIVTGTLGAQTPGSSGVLPTTGDFSVGTTGGAVVQPDGTLVGLAVKTDGGNGVIPTSQLRAALEKTPARPLTSPDMLAYQRIVPNLERHWYRRAVSPLNQLLKNEPYFPYATDILAAARQAIHAGQDRTPRPSHFLASATALVLLVLVTARTYVFARRDTIRLGPTAG
jgi:hypothetical protein